MQITFFQIYVRKTSTIWFCTDIIWVIRIVMRTIFQCRIQFKKSLFVINVMFSFWVISLVRNVKTIKSWNWKTLWTIKKLLELFVLINKRNRNLKKKNFTNCIDDKLHCICHDVKASQIENFIAFLNELNETTRFSKFSLMLNKLSDDKENIDWIASHRARK